MTKDEGGRYTPFTEGYRPQLFLRTADVTVGLTFPEGTPDAAEKMVIPGDNIEMVGTLVHDVAMEPGSRYVCAFHGSILAHVLVAGSHCVKVVRLVRIYHRNFQ